MTEPLDSLSNPSLICLYLLKLNWNISISSAEVSSWAPSPGKGLIIFGYVSGEDSEDRRSAAFIQMDGTMQLCGYISAFCTQGHWSLQ